MIYTEDVPVDEGHVHDLVASIKEEEQQHGRHHGQLIPALLGEIPGFTLFAIIDGFHRTASLKQLGKDEIFATIRPNCTWEIVNDLRILTATTHKSVKFSRLIEWVEEAWRHTPWVDQLKVSQAFMLRFARGVTGRRMGAETDADVREIKEWVDKKCKQWKIAPSSLYQHLVTAQVADPELVREARERKSGHKLEALTPQHLSVVAKQLPHRHDLQRLVRDEVIAGKLVVQQAKELAEAVSHAQTIEEAQQILSIWKRRTFQRLEFLKELKQSSDGVKREARSSDPEVRRRATFVDYYTMAEQAASKIGKSVFDVIAGDYAHELEVRFVEMQKQNPSGKVIRIGSREEDRPEHYTLETDFGSLTLFPERGLVVSPLLPKGEFAELTPTEAAFLEKMMLHPTRVYTPCMLMKAAFERRGSFDEPLATDANLVKTHISHLREKTGDVNQGLEAEERFRLIYTLKERGYTMRPNPRSKLRLADPRVGVVFEGVKMPELLDGNQSR